MRILVIEDDLPMLELLRSGLSEAGHTVTGVDDGEKGLEMALSRSFDAIVVEAAIAGRYRIAEQLRGRASRPAIMMLTELDKQKKQDEKNKQDEQLHGRDAGADDCLAKPFSLPELTARIASVVRRIKAASAEQFSFGRYRLDIAKRRLFQGQDEVAITRSEYLLLRALAMHRGEMVPRRQLVQAVWGTTVIGHGALDTLVNSLREKLSAGHAGLISAIRGSGYCLADEPEKAAQP